MKLSFLLVVLISGCSNIAEHKEQHIGYIGFLHHQSWAIQFNDCTEYEFQGAEKYLWFDRQLSDISCYRFKKEDSDQLRNSPIILYESPTTTAPKRKTLRFEELKLSDSGWGLFPYVYAKAKNNWYRVKEGWIQLTPADRQFVQFYEGSQDEAAKKAHNDYFHNH